MKYLQANIDKYHPLTQLVKLDDKQLNNFKYLSIRDKLCWQLRNKLNFKISNYLKTV